MDEGGNLINRTTTNTRAANFRICASPKHGPQPAAVTCHVMLSYHWAAVDGYSGAPFDRLPFAILTAGRVDPFVTHSKDRESIHNDVWRTRHCWACYVVWTCGAAMNIGGVPSIVTETADGLSQGLTSQRLYLCSSADQVAIMD